MRTVEGVGGTPTVRELMLGKQEEMEAALLANRRIMPHEGQKGASAELHWRDMLRNYLPRRYSVENGFVIDHEGGVSDEIDVIIHDAQYSPFLFHAGTSCFVPAESVFAIFDAKQTISRRTMAQTADKVASVRRLARTSGDIYTNTGVFEGKKPENQPILGGILAITCDWAEPFGDSLKNVLRELTDQHQVDLGAALSTGAFEVVDDSEEDVLTYDKDIALVGFFMALIRKLQPLATALSMDLEVWSEDLRRQTMT